MIQAVVAAGQRGQFPTEHRINPETYEELCLLSPKFLDHPLDHRVFGKLQITPEVPVGVIDFVHIPPTLDVDVRMVLAPTLGCACKYGQHKLGSVATPCVLEEIE